MEIGLPHSDLSWVGFIKMISDPGYSDPGIIVSTWKMH